MLYQKLRGKVWAMYTSTNVCRALSYSKNSLKCFAPYLVVFFICLSQINTVLWPSVYCLFDPSPMLNFYLTWQNQEGPVSNLVCSLLVPFYLPKTLDNPLWRILALDLTCGNIFSLSHHFPFHLMQNQISSFGISVINITDFYSLLGLFQISGLCFHNRYSKHSSRNIFCTNMFIMQTCWCVL